MKLLSTATLLLLFIIIAIVASSSTFIDAKKNLLRNLHKNNANTNTKVSVFNRTLNPATPIGNNQVDTRVACSGFGYGTGAVNPGPQYPNGAFRLGPDTSLGLEPFRLPPYSEGGYANGDPYMEGFSMTHVVGAGEAEWQNVLTTMVRAQGTTDVGQPPVPEKVIKNAGYRSKYSHDTEIAKPGYYSVLLEDPNIMAEITTTGNMAGMTKYSFDKGDQDDAVLIIDFAHGSPRTKHLFTFEYSIPEVEVIKATIVSNGQTALFTVRIIDAGMFLKNAPLLNGINVWFDIHVDLGPDAIAAGVTFRDMNLWQNFSFIPSSTAPINFQNNTSRSAGVALRLWGSGGVSGTLLVSSAISFLGPEYAAANLLFEQYTENGNEWMTFQQGQFKAQQVWENVFEQFPVTPFNGQKLSQWSGDTGVFYSALWRANLAPTDYSECQSVTNCGFFLGLDNTVHQNVAPTNSKKGTPPPRRLSDLSTWDTYRAHNALMILSNPELARDLTNSMLQMSLEAERPPLSNPAYFPEWVMASVETYTMCGKHSTSIALETLLKGVQGINNPNQLFDKIVTAVRTQNVQMPSHGKYGVWSNPGGYCTGIGATLEFAIDAAATRNAAIRYFKNESIAEEMFPYAQAYRNNYNTNRSYFCGRFANGSWDCPSKFDAYLPHPFEKGGFIEGNAIQYQWYAPGNMSDLMSLYPSKDFVAARLDKFIAESFYWPFNTTLPNFALWLGNEPSFLIPFVYNWIGNQYAYRTNDWLQKIYETYWFFGPTAGGGNDDYGAMSSLTSFFFLGMYPNTPGTQYALFAPRFPQAEIRVPASMNSTVSVRLLAQNLVQGKVNYLANASVNGKMLPTPFVDHSDLLATPAGSVPTIEFYCVQSPVTFGSSTIPPWGPPSSSSTEKEGKKRTAEIVKAVEEKIKKGEKIANHQSEGAVKKMMQTFRKIFS